MPDRVQQEIEELLARLESFPPKRSLWRRVKDPVVRGFHRLSRSLGDVQLPRVSAGHLLLVAIVVIVIGYVAIDAEDVARWVIVGGIILFIAAFILSLRRQSR